MCFQGFANQSYKRGDACLVGRVAGVVLRRYYRGIAVQVFLVSLFVCISCKKKTKEGTAADFDVWCSIVLAIVLFGLGHFPGTAAITAITPVIVVWAVLLNGVLGIPLDFCTGKGHGIRDGGALLG
jgi:hypothetical protein